MRAEVVAAPIQAQAALEDREEAAQAVEMLELQIAVAVAALDGIQVRGLRVEQAVPALSLLGILAHSAARAVQLLHRVVIPFTPSLPLIHMWHKELSWLTSQRSV
jgi:hypothetical protein